MASNCSRVTSLGYFFLIDAVYEKDFEHALRRVPSFYNGRNSDARALRDQLQGGDALVLRPLLLHASSKGNGHSRRRVLHFVFGPRELPCGLRWPEAAV